MSLGAIYFIISIYKPNHFKSGNKGKSETINFCLTNSWVLYTNPLKYNNHSSNEIEKIKGTVDAYPDEATGFNVWIVPISFRRWPHMTFRNHSYRNANH
jgi:hypothetical protein